MTKLGWTVLGVLVLLILGTIAIIMFWARAMPEFIDAPSTSGVIEGSELTGKSIYANGTYGFTIQYPQHASTTENFSSFYHLPPYWRANGAPDATGTPIVEIIGYSTMSDHAFPRYYTAMVRVGVSSDKKQVADCEKIVPDQGETALPDAVINGTTWKAFSFQDAAMMQYLKGVSYRIVHDGKCFVLEKLATGSSYTDDPVSADTIPQSTLDQAFAALDPVIQSFAFAAP